MNGRSWLIVGAVIAGLAVGCGALGAHWFEGQAKRMYEDENLRERRQANWETGAQYQMYHGLALLAVGLAAAQWPSRNWNNAAWLFVLGVFLFSGSLYGIALSGTTNLRDVPFGVPLIIATPVGGLCFLAGWLVFIVSACQIKTVRPAA